MSNRKNGIVMNKIYNPSKEIWQELLKRPSQTVEDIETTVYQIFNEVKIKGDVAIDKYTNLFDGVNINDINITENEITEAIKLISDDLKSAILLAKNNIERFHVAQKTEKVTVTTMDGVECWQEKRPIQKIGVYIPGGTAPLFSTVLMYVYQRSLPVVMKLYCALHPINKARYILQLFILPIYVVLPEY